MINYENPSEVVTGEHKIRSMIFKYGVFDSIIDQIMPLIKNELNDLVAGYKLNWNSPKEQYPSQLYVVIFNISKPIIYKWLSENKPNAWFKDAFAPIAYKDTFPPVGYQKNT